jgi:hypothetical protein
MRIFNLLCIPSFIICGNCANKKDKSSSCTTEATPPVGGAFTFRVFSAASAASRSSGEILLIVSYISLIDDDRVILSPQCDVALGNLLATDMISIVLFSANWCAPCKKTRDIFLTLRPTESNVGS